MYTLWVNSAEGVSRPVTVNGCLDQARARALRYSEDGDSVEIMSHGRVIEVIQPAKKRDELTATIYDIVSTKVGL